jgi:peptidyl-prolyl cis-trans isomerase C
VDVAGVSTIRHAADCGDLEAHREGVNCVDLLVSSHFLCIIGNAGCAIALGGSRGWRLFRKPPKDFRHMTIIRSAIAAAAVAFITAGPALAQKPGDKKDPVVAIVDGAKIRFSDLRALHASLPARVRRLPMQRIYRPLLDYAITTHLLAKAGRAAGLDKDKEIQRLMAQYMTRVVAQIYLRRETAKLVTDDVLKKAYEKYKSGFKGGEEVRASHILVKTKKEAQEVIAQLGKGKEFAKLAKERSTGPSKAQGGDLGYFQRGQMVKPFAEAAFGLKKGEYTKSPVKTQFGWHVIKLVDRRRKSAPPFAQVKAKLRQEAGRALQSQTVKGLRSNAKIERFKLDGSAITPPKTDGKKK